MKKHAKLLLSMLLALIMLLALSACDQAAAGTAAEPAQAASEQSASEAAEITVTASSTVTLAPDKSTVSFGVTSQDESAEAAQSQNTEAVNNVIAVLKEHGISEKSIRTEYYSLYPQYDYTYSVPQITGYSVSTTLAVRDQDVKDLGKLLTACVAAGITNVDNVNLQCSGYDQAYAQALAQAVEAAHEKAEGLAKASGKTLGEVVNVTEGLQDTYARYNGLNASANFAGSEGMGGDGPEIQPGETEITANVTVTYRMG